MVTTGSLCKMASAASLKKTSVAAPPDLANPPTHILEKPWRNLVVKCHRDGNPCFLSVSNYCVALPESGNLTLCPGSCFLQITGVRLDLETQMHVCWFPLYLRSTLPILLHHFLFFQRKQANKILPHFIYFLDSYF